MKRSLLGLLLAILLLPTNIYAEACATSEKTLYNEIKTHTSATLFDNISDNFVGISETDEKGEKVYLYTGKNGDSEPDNYAVIDNRCFRILRTTYTKGVKLVFYGDYQDNKCVQNNKVIPYDFPGEGWLEDDGTWGQKEFYYLSYMYGNNAPTNLGDSFKPEVDSRMKKLIDNWYKNNLLDYSDWFEDAIYCNKKDFDSWSCYVYTNNESHSYSTWDNPGHSFYEMCTTIPDPSNSNSVSASFTNYNLTRRNATLTCSKNDSYTFNNEDGNKALKYKVGTLSGDEIYFTKNEDGSWLQKNVYAAAPESYDSSSGGMSSLVSTGYDYDDDKTYVLPVVSVKELTYVVSGTGKKTEPYILANKICTPEPTTTTTTKKEIITGSDEVENPPTGVYNYIWVLPIVVLGGYITYEVIKNKRHFKSN